MHAVPARAPQPPIIIVFSVAAHQRPRMAHKMTAEVPLAAFSHH
jgi:hypothetical protein